ncbi:hypothetical protein PGTUg99_033888 [Puccinia graminis f. sp. tritici]|uniref:Uncharacterized protein n=1 Tax=Puccinia graminis f. sp. tritici TaxID=56615 RepID=A0A5B0RMW2_PUCGR|nr:hypothetical protein PGTUg99_033888 [Puccinia graminis f. sp. tritici]
MMIQRRRKTNEELSCTRRTGGAETGEVAVRFYLDQVYRLRIAVGEVMTAIRKVAQWDISLSATYASSSRSSTESILVW